jgi:hypothetical protein
MSCYRWVEFGWVEISVVTNKSFGPELYKAILFTFVKSNLPIKTCVLP